MKRKKSYFERQRAEARITTFANLGQRLNATTTMDEAARIIVAAADDLLQWDACYLDLYSIEDDTITPVLNVDIVNGRRIEVPPAYAGIEPSPFVRRVIAEGAQLICREGPDTSISGLVPFGDLARPSASLMFAPIRNGKKQLGILSIQSYTPKAYTREDLNTLQALADHCGGALERIRVEQERKTHARQQAVVAELGLRALAGADLEMLMNEAVARVAQALEVEYCKVLELLPDGKIFRLCAGVGWKEGYVGKATVGAGTESQAGYTLLFSEPVIVEDLRSETRFNGPPFLHEHGVVSGMSVVIHGQRRAFGVLGVHTKKKRKFTKDDAHFLQAIANVLATAIERKRAEKALHDALEKLKEMEMIINRSPAIVLLWRAAEAEGWPVDFVSDNISQLGYTQEDFVSGRIPYAQIVHPEDLERVREEVLRYSREGLTEYTQEYRILTKSGDPRWVDDRTWVRRDANGAITHYQGIILDITKRKRAEEALKEREEWFKEIFEGSRDAIFLVESNARFIEVNQAACELTGYSREELLSLSIPDLHDEADSHAYRKYFKTIMSGMDVTSEAPLRRKDGTKVPTEFSNRRIVFRGKEVMHTTARDVTERKRAEEQIRQSLLEKEVLLKEIHHRVKNNLQIISSLLNLQSHHLKSGQALEMFRESQNRVKSIALIHEKLYKSKDLARVDFAEYLRHLTADLFRAYRVDANAVAFKINIEEVSLSVDLAIPCGLIVNELVSNALKHAFPPSAMPSALQAREEQNEIQVELHSDREKKLTLIVRDNGIGFPPNLDFRKTESLGLQLVNTLADQLGGAIALDGNGGTTFKIVFRQ
jgi:PAS domain S-box-containing protein